MQGRLFALVTVLILGTTASGTLPAVRAATPPPPTATSTLPLTPLIPKTTIVLQPATIRALNADQRGGLLDLRQPSLKLQFERLTPDLQALRPGDVIVGGVTSDTPYGLLRKVTAVIRSGSGIQVATAPAALTDAIAQGAFNVQRRLAAADIASFQALLPGIAAGSPQLRYPFCIKAANVPLVVAGTGSLTSAPVKASGSITASGQICAAITFGLSMRISGPSLEYPAGRFLLQFRNSGAEMTDLRLTGRGAVTVQQTYQLGEFYLQPIAFTVGPVPVVITPTVVITIGAGGHVTASVTAGVTQTDTYQAGLQCTNDDCSAAATVPAPTFTLDPVTVSAGTSVSAYGTPELDLLLYGLAGPELDLRGYVEADASATSVNLSDPVLSWVVYGGFQVQIGIALDIVGVYHKDYSQTVYSWRTVLARSRTASPVVVAPAVAPTLPSVSSTPIVSPSTATPSSTTVPLTTTATVTPVPTV